MATAKLFYLLSEQGRKNSILNGGDGKEFQIVETEATPEILDLAQVKTDGSILLPVGCNADEKNGRWFAYHWKPVTDYRLGTGFGDEPQITEIRENTYFDAAQTVDQLLVYERGRVARLAKRSELEAELAPKRAAWKEKLAGEYNRKEKLKADTAAAEKARQEAAEKERYDWIMQNGSDHLRDAVGLGYNCQRLYATERAAVEHPDYTLDFDDNASWDGRACPSPEALAEVKELVAAGLSAEVVWLTTPADRDDYDVFDSCEAIIVRNYLRRYDLVKMI